MQISYLIFLNLKDFPRSDWKAKYSNLTFDICYRANGSAIQAGICPDMVVANRVFKIKQHQKIKWRHVEDSWLRKRCGGTAQNGLRILTNGQKTFHTQQSTATEAETKMVREVLYAAQVENLPDDFEQLLKKHDFYRTLRICAWIQGSTYNCRNKEKRRGPLTTEEMNNARSWWIIRVQHNCGIEKDREQFKLQKNAQLRITRMSWSDTWGVSDLYLPDCHTFTEKLVQEIHWRTLHGGVGLTMTRVRKKY